jgi:hypothetical protein
LTIDLAAEGSPHELAGPTGSLSPVRFHQPVPKNKSITNSEKGTPFHVELFAAVVCASNRAHSWVSASRVAGRAGRTTGRMGKETSERESLMDAWTRGGSGGAI